MTLIGRAGQLSAWADAAANRTAAPMAANGRSNDTKTSRALNRTFREYGRSPSKLLLPRHLRLRAVHKKVIAAFGSAETGADYYTYQLLLDLKVGKDWAVRTEPHPRFYTDPTDTVPIAVPALLRTEWWPMISFVVFKSPVEGHTHIFRPGEPMLPILILPVIADFTLAAMDEEEAAEREMRGRRIHGSRPSLAADTTWTSRTDTVFDGTYRHLLRAAKARERE